MKALTFVFLPVHGVFRFELLQRHWVYFFDQRGAILPLSSTTLRDGICSIRIQRMRTRHLEAATLDSIDVRLAPVGCNS